MSEQNGEAVEILGFRKGHVPDHAMWEMGKEVGFATRRESNADLLP